MYTWTKKEGDIYMIGITEEAAKAADEFVFIEMPEKGKKIKKGDKLLTLEAVKWTGTIESPVTGEVVETNQEVFNDPSLINKDPSIWIVKIKGGENNGSNE